MSSTNLQKFALFCIYSVNSSKIFKNYCTFSYYWQQSRLLLYKNSISLKIKQKFIYCKKSSVCLFVLLKFERIKLISILFIINLLSNFERNRRICLKIKKKKDLPIKLSIWIFYRHKRQKYSLT